MKRNLIIAVACSVVAIACHNTSKKINPGGYTIEGTVKGMDSGWIFFGHSDTADYVTDSVHIKDGQFTYMGKVTQPTQFMFWFNPTANSKRMPVDFFVENTYMQMSIDKDSVKNAKITGGSIEDLYGQYKEFLKPIRDKMKVLDNSYAEASKTGNKEAMDSIVKLYDQLEGQQQDAIVSYVDKNPSSLIGAWSVSRNLLYDVDMKTLKKVYTEFAPAVQQSGYGKTIKGQVDIEEKMQIGMVAPDFTQNDTTGKPVTLSSFKGKYVLLDFWASWCGPCRRENPNVLDAYKKFKDKNFTILGVSLDENKQAWMKAIKDDGLVWNHVSDLKAWGNAAAAEYGIKAIPSNYLLDPEGKILAHNLRGEELEKALAEAIK